MVELEFTSRELVDWAILRVTSDGDLLMNSIRKYLAKHNAVLDYRSGESILDKTWIVRFENDEDAVLFRLMER